jgi:hypothetical protein
MPEFLNVPFKNISSRVKGDFWANTTLMVRVVIRRQTEILFINKSGNTG